MRALIMFIIALLFSANLAWADIVATWILSDGAVSKLSIRDNQHVRIDTNEKDTYMLLTNQKVYMVAVRKRHDAPERREAFLDHGLLSAAGGCQYDGDAGNGQNAPRTDLAAGPKRRG